MARQTFITDINVSKVGLCGYGVLTDLEYYDETIDIPSKSDIRKLIAEETGQITHGMDMQNRKLAKAAEQAKTAAKDAAEAKEAVERLIETARETFREIIAELLEPHYRLLAQHLGIELPTTAAKPKAATKEPSSPVQNTPQPESTGRPRSEGTGKKRRGTGDKAPKKRTISKATAAVRHTKTKGTKPCRKK